MITSNDILSSHLSLFVKNNVSNYKRMKNTFFTCSLKKSFVVIMFTITALLFGLQRTYAQSATTITVGGSSTINSISNNVSTVVDPSITITGNGLITNFSVQITDSYTAGDILEFTGTPPSGISYTAFNTTTRSIVFTGSLTPQEWSSLLQQVKLKTSSAVCFPEARKVAFIAGGMLYNPLNGHYYIKSPSTNYWTQSRNAAASSSYYGLQGYIATITSAAENSFVSVLLNSDTWIGGSDNYNYINQAVGYILYTNQAAAEGKFYWVAGPEKGTQLTSSNFSAGWLTSTYNNWNGGGEPNNSWGTMDASTGTTGEHYLHFLSNGAKWNDYGDTYNSLYSVFEYGGMAGDNLSSLPIFTRNIYVNGAPTSGISGGNVNVCSGSNSTTLTLPGFTGTVNYWQSSTDNFLTAGNTTNIAVTTTSLVVTNITATTYYRAVVTSGSCSALATSPVAINVNSSSPGILSSSNSTICQGGTASITIYNSTGTVLNWQSSTSSTFASGITTISSTATTLTPTIATAGTFYYRANVQPTCGLSAYTSGLPVTVSSGTPPVGGAVTNANHCTSTGSGTLTLSGYTGTITKWQYQNSGDVLWNDISNTTTTLSYSGLTNTRTYRTVLTNTGCGTANSSGGLITFGTTPVVTGTSQAKIGSTSQLSSSTGNSGATWTSSNTAIATVSTTGLVSAVAVGTTNITHTSSVGCVGNVVVFTANPLIPPTITTPTNITSNCGGIVNGPVNFTVGDTDATTLTALVVMASSSNTSLIPNANITITQPNASGAASFIYTPLGGQTGSSTITLTVTDQDGATATAVFTITVNTSTISAVSNAVNDLACGSTASGSLTTTITGGTGYTYQWSWSSSVSGTYSTGFTSPLVTPAPSFSPTNLLGGYYYRLTVTDACGTTMTSTPVQLNSVTAMTIAATSSTNNCYGASNGTITVTTTGGGTSQVATAVSGSNTYTQSVSTFTSPNRTFVLSNLPAGTYTVSVADANSSCNPSTTVTVAQEMAPITVLGDGCAYKTSLVAAAGQTSYTWYKDDVAISGATNNTYTPTIAGEYEVQVLNGTCATLSTPTTIYTCGVTPTGSMSPFATSTTIVSREGAKNNGEGIDQRGKILNQPSPPLVTTGLQLHYDAGNVSSYSNPSATWNDISGNTGRNATFVNSPTFNTGNGGSIYTNGLDQYAQSSYTGSATDSYTFSAWFKNDNYSEPKYILGRGRDGAGNGWSLQLQVSTGGIVTAGVVPTVPSTIGIVANGTSTLALNTWYYITAVWTAGQSIKVYVNGSLEGTTTLAGTSLRTSTNGWWIGSISTTIFTSGYNAVAQVYNSVLSEAQILQNFNADKTRFGY